MISHEERYCPIAKCKIDEEVCYEMVMCLTCGFKPSSVPEVTFTNNEETKKICDGCKYSNWD